MVNTLGVLLGVAAASNSRKIVLAGGLAAMFAESVSMLAVAFTSKQAEWEFYRSERAREFRHIARVPNLERQEIRVMFEKLGFKVLFLKQTYAQHTKKTKKNPSFRVIC